MSIKANSRAGRHRAYITANTGETVFSYSALDSKQVPFTAFDATMNMIGRALILIAAGKTVSGARCAESNYCNGHGTCIVGSAFERQIQHSVIMLLSHQVSSSTCACFVGWGADTDLATIKNPDCSSREFKCCVQSRHFETPYSSFLPLQECARQGSLGLTSHQPKPQHTRSLNAAIEACAISNLGSASASRVSQGTPASAPTAPTSVRVTVDA